MDSIQTKLLVIGAGPGGYVCAIRAAQLGVDTVIVEAEKPGGTCLNVGCIPSKAMIHAADEFHKLMRFSQSNGAAEHLGIQSKGASIDLNATQAWKNGIVKRLNGGVSGLLKRANVNVIQGAARFRDGKTVVVDSAEGPLQINAENIVIATGQKLWKCRHCRSGAMCCLLQTLCHSPRFPKP